MNKIQVFFTLVSALMLTVAVLTDARVTIISDGLVNVADPEYSAVIGVR